MVLEREEEARILQCQPCLVPLEELKVAGEKKKEIVKIVIDFHKPRLETMQKQGGERTYRLP